MELTDGELLSRFLASGEQSAFEIVVRRHSSLVFGICTRILGTTHDAEDAAQAVFLTLAHKASSLRQYSSIAGWLYHVAFNVAQRTREAAKRRNNREREAGERMEAQQNDENAEWEELKPLVDTELHALPEKYRLPLILHYIEGRSQEEIATLLGCSYGTVSGRLNYARNLLRERILRRGLAVSPAVLFLLIPKFSPVAMPEGVVTASAKAATLIAAGNAAAPGLVSTQAAALTQGALRMMYVSKLKIAALVVVGVTALAGVGAIAIHATAADTPQAQPTRTLKPVATTTAVAAAPAPAAASPAPAPAPAGEGEKPADPPPVAVAAKTAPTAEEIQGWINDLSSDDVTVRSTAYAKLRNCGEAAKDVLTKLSSAKSRAGEEATRLLATLQTHTILAKATEKAQACKSIEANMSMTQTAMGMGVTASGDVKAIPSAKKMRMNMTATIAGMKIPMLMVCDGTTFWQEMVMPAGKDGVKMVTKFPASYMDQVSNTNNSCNSFSAETYESLIDFTEMKNDTLEGKEVYVVSGHMNPDAIELGAKKAEETGGVVAGQMAKATLAEIDKAVLYVGKEDYFVYKYEALNKDGKATQTVNLSDIKVDAPIDEQEFIYCPPPGVTVLDGMEQLKALKSQTPPVQAPPKAKENF
jgi:RNA polymerase sigma factor (sigma-70 family)